MRDVDVDETLATTGDDSGGGVSRDEREDAPVLASGTKVGRFVVLARVGVGGMGEVYSAFDPELDRRVAIKLLRRDAAGSGEIAEARLRREARTMARLVDRNLVTVHDVGVHDGRVFVAMEFVDGETLRTWCAGKPWDEILAAYLAAGRGLAAAHAAGIVHRDFKPDNVLVARDGRVAVTDFGIARTHDTVDIEEPGAVEDLRLTSTGAIIGTPRFMAPEQLEGALADARSDQFSLCVSLWEALYGAHPFAESGMGFPALREAVLAGVLRAPPSSKVPSRVREALARGLARDPAARFANVNELLDALDVLAPSRRWVWGVLAGAGVIAAASIAYGAWVREHRNVDAQCTGSEALLRGVWDDGRRADVARAFAATHLSYADVALGFANGRLDDWSHRWIDARTRACRATRVYAEQSEATLEAQMHCFDGERTQVRALVDALAHGTPEVVGNASWTLGQLPHPARCADARTVALSRPLDPARARMVDDVEDRLAQAKALAEAGDTRDSVIALGPVAIDAQLTGYPQTIAHVEAALGEAEVSNGDMKEARGHLERAFALADEARDDHLRGDLAVELGTLAYYDSRYDDARRWLSNAEAIIHRTGEDELLAHVAMMRGSVDFYDGQLARARDELDDAAHRFAAQAGDPDEAMALSMLAEVEGALGEPNVAMIDYQKAVDLGMKRFGPGHPQVAKLLGNFGAFLVKHDRLDEALPMFQRALAIKQAALGPDDPSLGFPTENIAVVERRRGDLAAAERDYARALALFETSPDDAYAVPAALNGLALVRMGRAEYADAVPLLERALALRADQKHDLDDGENHLQLAVALWKLGRARGEAKRHGLLAREIFKDLGDPAKEHLAEAERWLGDPDHFVPSVASSF